MAAPQTFAIGGLFALGWTVAVGGGVALLLSAFTLGEPLIVLGVVLASSGFVLIGWVHRAPRTSSRPARLRTNAGGGPGVALWGIGPDEAASPPARVEPPTPATPLAPIETTIPAGSTASGEELESGRMSLGVPEVLSDPRMTSVDPSPSRVAPSSPSEGLGTDPGPGEARGDVVPGPDSEGVIGSSGGGPPSPPAPDDGPGASAGEVPPAGSARSLALLGLPWDPGPTAEAAEAHRSVPEPSPPLEFPPGEPWREIPSIVFSGEAQRWTVEEWREDLLEATLPARASESALSRSGAFVPPRPPAEGFSSSWIVPGLSVLDTRGPPRDAIGLVTRVPEPPARAGRRLSRCTACGDPSGGGASGENRCWGCGRPVCTDCFWRYGPGPAIHRCPSCVALGPPMSVSGGRRTTRSRGPFGSADEPDWNEGI